MWQAPGHVCGHRNNVFVQIRAAEMTLQALSQIEMAGQLWRSQHSGKIGALFIVAATAPPPRWDVARRQRDLIRSLESDGRLFLCAVFEGQGLSAMAQRAVLRTIFRARQRTIAEDTAGGVQWLTGALACQKDAGQLLDFVQSLRGEL
jgi:hypothetical protein